MDLHADTTLTLMRIAQLQALASTLSAGAEADAATASGSFAQQLALASSALSPSSPEQPAPASPADPTAPAEPTAVLAEQYPRSDLRLGPTNPRF